jgi:hypothetical protein
MLPALRLAGSGFDTLDLASVTLTLGNTGCANLTLISATAFTCITAKPDAKLYGPQPVAMFVPGRGNALCNATYEFVDLWSRRSTWGGADPPSAGDSAVIPAGANVVLDVSPPLLHTLVLEGSLRFDEDSAEELHLQVGLLAGWALGRLAALLCCITVPGCKAVPPAVPDPHLPPQAHYILLRGGNLTAGSEAAPFPGHATITLHGAPDSRELPLYGAKVIAVREGRLLLHGQPKVPTWTQLNATAHPGATSISVAGPVNWVPGGREAGHQAPESTPPPAAPTGTHTHTHTHAPSHPPRPARSPLHRRPHRAGPQRLQRRRRQ